MKISLGWLAVALTMAPFVIHAQPMAGPTGMTLYTFDKDSNVSACYDQCAVNWPPFVGQAGETMGDGWTLIDRTDGTKQWAYDGKPTYYYIEDTAKGDTNGDGKGGVWHVLTN